MNRISQLFSRFFNTAHPLPANTARSLLERATHARGQSRHEAAQLRANAQALLSVLR